MRLKALQFALGVLLLVWVGYACAGAQRIMPGCFDRAALRNEPCGTFTALATPTPVPTNLPNSLWVSTSGSDIDPCTAVAPCATNQHAANIVTAGETIVDMPGTYQATSGYLIIVSVSGSSGSPIGFMCETYHTCIWDGDSQSATSAVDFDDSRSYYTFSYFVIQNFHGSAINANGGSDGSSDANTHITLYDDRLTGNGDGMRGAAYSNDDAVIGSEIDHTGNFVGSSCTNSADDHGLYISGGNWLIVNDVFHDNDCGWDIQYATETGDTPTGSVIANDTFGWHANQGGSSNPGYVVLYANGIQTPSVSFVNDYFLQNTGTYGSPVHCYPTTVVGSPTISVTYSMEGNSAAISDCSSYTSSNITQNVAAMLANPVAGATAASYEIASSASPLRGAGTTVSGVTTDFYGYTRPSPPSVGAFEFPY